MVPHLRRHHGLASARKHRVLDEDEDMQCGGARRSGAQGKPRARALARAPAHALAARAAAFPIHLHLFSVLL